MRKLIDWREAIALPIITEAAKWNLIEFETILTEAIALCVAECLEKNNGIICATLSGGLDSSFCLAKIREMVGPKAVIHTFTTGGSEKHPDVQFAKIAFRYFGANHHELIPSGSEIKKSERELFSRWKDEVRALGNVAVFMTYKNIARHGFQCVIAHDGIDELLGGYWEHREQKDAQAKAEVFRSFWGRLKKEHLLLLERKARYFGIEVVLPYLQKDVVKYIAKIPLDERSTLAESKIPLRTIAKKYLPMEIIQRKKMGFCSALDQE